MSVRLVILTYYVTIMTCYWLKNDLLITYELLRHYYENLRHNQPVSNLIIKVVKTVSHNLIAYFQLHVNQKNIEKLKVDSFKK